MSEPFVGEIRMFGGNFAPLGWAFCQGQLVPIAENDVLFALIGTTYGGDGQGTFALPDLRGRIPIHAGNGYSLGQKGGVEAVTLTVPQMSAHTHLPVGLAAAGNQPAPANGVWALSNLVQYSTDPANGTMASQAIGPVGGSQPHSNMMPFQCVSFIIALYGIFPTSN